jgi:hypothetical protein
MASYQLKDIGQYSTSNNISGYVLWSRTIGDHAAFFWERFKGMARNEPCGLDIVALEHLEQATNTNRSGEETWGAYQFVC